VLIHDLNFVTRAICVNFLNVLLFDMLSTILFGEVGSFFLSRQWKTCVLNCSLDTALCRFSV